MTPDLETLARLFYPTLEELGKFSPVADSDMPDPYRRLLAHEHHMTVTVEAFHGSPVDVRVIDKQTTPTHYARKIALVSQATRDVVQFGIMRVHLAHLAKEVRSEIESEGTPLGRILIEHGVLREVHLLALWKVECGEDLAALFGRVGSPTTYGRVALIDFNGEPAVELLEIVAPV